MATTTASITLSSTDLLSDELDMSTSATLTQAANSTGLTQAMGLSRKTTSSTDQYTLFKADDYTADKAHKIYLKNTETTAARYFLVSIDDEPIGRLYAGDWCFMPWSATDGVPATFTAAPTGSWGDTTDSIVFDGVTITGASGSAGVVDAMVAAKYPNWTCTESSSTVALYTAKDSNILYQIEEGTTPDEFAVTTAGSGVITTARVTAAVASANDIKITPGQANASTLEYMLLHE